MNKDDILIWTRGINLFKKGLLQAAIDTLLKVASYSKVAFDIAVISQHMGNHSQALDYLDSAIEKDSYMAVAYLQRAYSLFLDAQYEFAFDDYSVALELLLDNSFIDYTQIGMHYKLYKAEVLFNRGMCWNLMGDEAASINDIRDAQRCAITDDQKSLINEAARIGSLDLTLFSLPADILFQITDSKVKNIETKTFLKKATVVHSRNQDDEEYSGFSGATILSRDDTLKKALEKPQTNYPVSPPASPVTIIATRKSSSAGLRILPKHIKVERSPTKIRSRASSLNKLKSPDSPRVQSPGSARSLSGMDSSVPRKKSHPSPLSPLQHPSSSSSSSSKFNWINTGIEIAQSPQSYTPGESPLSNYRMSDHDSFPLSAGATSTIKFKFHYRDAVHCCVMRQDLLTVDALYDKIETKLNLVIPCKIQYKDEVGDLFMLNDGDDLELAKESGKLWVMDGDIALSEVKGGRMNAGDLFDFY